MTPSHIMTDVQSPEDLMLKDLRDRYDGHTANEAFRGLYDARDPSAPMFAHFHVQLNAHFSFMNQKARTNRHFNADASRQLLSLIEEIQDAHQILRRVGADFTLDERYKQVLDACSGFLSESYGSEIPADFPRIELIKFEPVFTSPNIEIRLPARRANAELKMVGSGAFAHVYRYVDEEYGIPIALKRAKRDLDPKDHERFRREFDLMKSLHYPYVLSVYRYDEDKSEYTMEYCDATLHDFIERNNARLGPGTRKRIALQFLFGMNYLHSKGHLHRDVSYQNVLLKVYDGGAVLVKLSDFGLSKEHDSSLTRTDSELRGTILDPTITNFKGYLLANEIYAIGFVLSFIFSGRKDIGACSGAVKPIIDKCVAYDHAARYGDVRSIIRDIELLETEPPISQAETPS